MLLMEILDIVDINGNPTGQTVTREKAHLEGIRHRTSHVWILRSRDRLQVLLQKRSPDKESFPDMWDISSAGHIPSGFSWEESAVRELSEELGTVVSASELKEAGLLRIKADTEFFCRPFKDDQVSKVFVLFLDRDESCFTVQKEELSEVRWFYMEDVISDLKAGLMGDCLILEELELVRDFALKEIS